MVMTRNLKVFCITIAGLLALPILVAQNQPAVAQVQTKADAETVKALQEMSDPVVDKKIAHAVLQTEFKFLGSSFTKWLNWLKESDKSGKKIGYPLWVFMTGFFCFGLVAGGFDDLSRRYNNVKAKFFILYPIGALILLCMLLCLFNAMRIDESKTPSVLTFGGLRVGIKDLPVTSPLLVGLKDFLFGWQVSKEKVVEANKQIKPFSKQLLDLIQTILSKQNEPHETNLQKIHKKYGNLLWLALLAIIYIVAFVAYALAWFFWRYVEKVRGFMVFNQGSPNENSIPILVFQPWYHYAVYVSGLLLCCVGFCGAPLLGLVLPPLFNKLQPCHDDYIVSLTALTEKIDISKKETPEPIKKIFGELKNQMRENNGKLALTNEQASIVFRLLYEMASLNQSYFAQVTVTESAKS